jgi:G8 domain/IPT/TIG domain
LLQSISPRFGTVTGGTTVTFSGVNFATDTTLYTVTIDGVNCPVSSATATAIQCVTGKRPGVHQDSTLSIQIAGMGNVATQGLIYRYASLWSDTITWGGEFAPIEGDLVYVPKGLHLLVDVDSTPILSAVVVEGSLIFPPDEDPNHLRTFDAHYVMIRDGYFEIGTEQFPYTSKLTITMHSNRQSPELPIFGNKVIAMLNGVLDIHGVPRNPTWTMLDSTSEAGSTTLTMMRDVDWQVGERIVIAPTDYFHTHAEERQIVSIDRTNPSKPILTIDSPLEYKHYAGIQFFGDDFIEMRAEVGLLTRNVLYRGDPETSAANQYGAQIMVHADSMHSMVGMIARIEYLELFNVGQAFQLGRYPIHFHLIGQVHESYIRGNAIH